MSEILGTLELIRKRLDEFIGNAIPRNEKWVILSNLVDLEGRPYEGARDKVVMFLAGIRRESTISTYNPNLPVKGTANRPGQGNPFAVVAPPLYINLFLLLFANFEGQGYTQGLELISRTIIFFQQNPWFTHDNLPGLDPRIDKLTFEMIDPDLIDLNYLMGLAGVTYLPAVYYKVRMIPFQSAAMQAVVPAVEGLEAAGEPGDPGEDRDS